MVLEGIPNDITSTYTIHVSTEDEHYLTQLYAFQMPSSLYCIMYTCTIFGTPVEQQGVE